MEQEVCRPLGLLDFAGVCWGFRPRKGVRGLFPVRLWRDLEALLRIGKLGVSRGRLEYCDAQVAAGVEDYYAGRGESPGRWAVVASACSA